jgi:hypothetical protein
MLGDDKTDKNGARCGTHARMLLAFHPTPSLRGSALRGGSRAVHTPIPPPQLNSSVGLLEELFHGRLREFTSKSLLHKKLFLTSTSIRLRNLLLTPCAAFDCLCFCSYEMGIGWEMDEQRKAAVPLGYDGGAGHYQIGGYS